MNSNLRTFIAIKIKPEPELIKLLGTCKTIFKYEAIKWVEENNLHLTLKFLGDTSEVQVDEIKSVLDEIKMEIDPFQFKIKGLGFFKYKGHPKVIFAGIEDYKAIKNLADELNNRFYELGFEKETREFKPHLTLGRIKFLKDKKHFLHFIEENINTEFQKVDIDEVIFYESILKTPGPKYNPLKIILLK